MKIKCDCGALVCEGDLIIVKTERGTKKKFVGKLKKDYDMVRELKMNGKIIKNNSNDPNNWTGVCSKCQSKEICKEIKNNDIIY